MKGSRILWCIIASIFVVCVAGNATAGWKEDQAALFQRIQVKPGDKIDSSNWEKVKDILPPSVVNWVKKGDWILDIGELKWDYNSEPAWLEGTAANAGKYDIGAGGELVEKATGIRPGYVDGEPFPEIDWKNDPKAGEKLVYNILVRRSRVGDFHNSWLTDWVGRRGLERTIAGDSVYRFYWSRPNGSIDNPAGSLTNELVVVKEPYDIAGIVSLTLRSIDEKADQVFSYIPAIRRTKRLAGTTRSSPFMGTDFVLDDTIGWYGKNETMDWKIVGQKITLMPMPKWALDGPPQFIKQANGSWVPPAHLGSPTIGFDSPGWKGAPWAPVDLVYVPRLMYIVQAKAKDPYYNYGDTTYYVDSMAGFSFKVINDRAGDYWKTMVLPMQVAKWGENNKVTSVNAVAYITVDDKTDHASICNAFGKTHDNNYVKVIYNTPTVKASMFSPMSLAAMSK